ncbi:tRNA pseudouridine synthase A [Caloramator mitchellensis]|uniref:tRNA pseudouridine synthase A n=1 Tax=Caloramator mitchellensis TaxID=908809 RepID=A0A0R3JUS3_CALMK|nr:tRNA pseudouridine(38-40) synthase TruA [Caloramator mitchellensis]KRQ87265.1 tRNA pseudouridine synthase A [Caloramator mitchellensis]
MRNIKLIIEYDGTNYCGWQKQKNGISIEEMIEKSIEKILKEKVELIGSSRTDAKVHAKGQVANFFTNTRVPAEKICNALNSVLPEDIKIIHSEEVSKEFHSRYDSKGKKYSYLIVNREVPLALYRNYAAHVKYDLNLGNMQEACKYFLGEHDFSAFRSTGSSVKTSVRNIMLLELIKRDEFITVNIEANGFLYNMVRIIVGTLIDVGRGKIKPNEIKDIIQSKDRKRAGATAPPQGLYLEKVYY